MREEVVRERKKGKEEGQERKVDCKLFMYSRAVAQQACYLLFSVYLFQPSPRKQRPAQPLSSATTAQLQLQWFTSRARSPRSLPVHLELL